MGQFPKYYVELNIFNFCYVSSFNSLKLFYLFYSLKCFLFTFIVNTCLSGSLYGCCCMHRVAHCQGYSQPVLTQQLIWVNIFPHKKKYLFLLKGKCTFKAGSHVLCILLNYILSIGDAFKCQI